MATPFILWSYIIFFVTMCYLVATSFSSHDHALVSYGHVFSCDHKLQCIFWFIQCHWMILLSFNFLVRPDLHLIHLPQLQPLVLISLSLFSLFPQQRSSSDFVHLYRFRSANRMFIETCFLKFASNLKS